MKDPYAALGLTKSASQADIKSAYRKLAKKYHPDANSGDETAEKKFKEISAAYAIIGDPDKRKDFDEGRIDAEGVKRAEQQFYDAYNTGGFRNAFDEAAGKGGQDFSADDVFAEIFGGFGKRTRSVFKRKGGDINYAIQVSFKDAALGAKRPLNLMGGKLVNVTIPAGTKDGAQLRLKGQGQAGANGGTNGDALIEINVNPHKFFTRKGDNIHVDVPIRVDEAVLGGSITVPTLTGKVSVKVPAGATTGTTLRLRGKGAKTGDQFVHLMVHTPKDPDKDFKEFIQKWGKKQNTDPRKDAGLI